jgi:heme O synthase-like polyprenyltransferase
MKIEMKPAFYALSPGAWRDYVTLLHLPFTVWHVSYVVLGATAAPVLHLDRLAWTCLAFFLGVGLAAHALDELHDRPLRSRIPDGILRGIAGTSLVIALLIGVYASSAIGTWAVPFVLFGGVMVLAYNLEWSGGRFHSGVWFGLAWGAFPALVGYWANAERLDPEAFLIAGACFVLSLAQRVLSRQVKSVRRNAHSVSGRIAFKDGRTEQLSAGYLISPPETALKLIGAAVALFATGLLVSRV